MFREVVSGRDWSTRIMAVNRLESRIKALCSRCGSRSHVRSREVSRGVQKWECKDGGGTLEGYVCVEDATDGRGLVAESSENWGAELSPGTAPEAAKTPGGIACINVSRWCILSFKVAVHQARKYVSA